MRTLGLRMNPSANETTLRSHVAGSLRWHGRLHHYLYILSGLSLPDSWNALSDCGRPMRDSWIEGQQHRLVQVYPQQWICWDASYSRLGFLSTFLSFFMPRCVLLHWRASMLELLYECRTSCMDRLSKYDTSLEEAENLKPHAKITMCNIWYLRSKSFAKEKMEGKSYRKEWLTLQVYWIPTCWNHSPRGNYCSVINTQSVHM